MTQMLDGRWKATYVELSGSVMTPDVVAAIELLLESGHYTVGNDHGTYSIDMQRAPHAMDITGTEGPNAGRTIPAIFVASADELVICYNLGGGERPASFTTRAGTREFLVRYKRAG
jgi:uncharacterized protein (TIGR03067 family)